MKNTIHLIDTDEPLQYFSGLLMRCGKILESAEMVYARHIGETLFAPNLAIRFCPKCFYAVPTGEAKRLYEYGLREKPKKEARSEEAQAAIFGSCIPG